MQKGAVRQKPLDVVYEKPYENVVYNSRYARESGNIDWQMVLQNLEVVETPMRGPPIPRIERPYFDQSNGQFF